MNWSCMVSKEYKKQQKRGPVQTHDTNTIPEIIKVYIIETTAVQKKKPQIQKISLHASVSL